MVFIKMRCFFHSLLFLSVAFNSVSYCASFNREDFIRDNNLKTAVYIYRGQVINNASILKEEHELEAKRAVLFGMTVGATIGGCCCGPVGSCVVAGVLGAVSPCVLDEKEQNERINDWIKWKRNPYFDLWFRTTNGEGELIYDFAIRLRPNKKGWLKKNKHEYKSFKSIIEFAVFPKNRDELDQPKNSFLKQELDDSQEKNTYLRRKKCCGLYKVGYIKEREDIYLEVSPDTIEGQYLFKKDLGQYVSFNDILSYISRLRTTQQKFQTCSWSGQKKIFSPCCMDECMNPVKFSILILFNLRAFGEEFTFENVIEQILGRQNIDVQEVIKNLLKLSPKNQILSNQHVINISFPELR